MNSFSFPVSDLIAGYVQSYDAAKKCVVLKTTDGREYAVTLTDTTYAEVVRNLGESFHDATGRIGELCHEGNYLFAYGTHYPEAENKFEAKHIVFNAEQPEEYRFEEQDWWINQVKQLGEFYLKSQFGDGPIDYSKYRTNLDLSGDKNGNTRQETDTISRLVYGFASAYLMTGDDRFLEAAEKGTEYLRQHFRFEDAKTGTACWYHAIDIKSDGSVQKVCIVALASARIRGSPVMRYV
jgi:hypothetical protein